MRSKRLYRKIGVGWMDVFFLVHDTGLYVRRIFRPKRFVADVTVASSHMSVSVTPRSLVWMLGKVCCVKMITELEIVVAAFA